MDAYGDYLSGWYDKFVKEKNQLIVELAKGSYADLFAGKMTSAELFKNVPTTMGTAAAMPSQGAVVEKLMKDYPWNGTVAAAMADTSAGRYVEEMSGSVVAALNLDVKAFNREIAGLATHNAAIKGIVDRAVELSTMQHRADTETASEDDESPNAVEEFVENNPEEARTITEELRHIILQSSDKPKEWWSGLSALDQCKVMFECSRYMFNSTISSVTMGGGLVTGTFLAGQLVSFLVAIVFISWDAEQRKDS
ncbi:MAG: hypothetical protein E7J02_13135 [Staphylococcus warneri]|nr:hypothetical protein [Staphylococcus warneri]